MEFEMMLIGSILIEVSCTVCLLKFGQEASKLTRQSPTCKISVQEKTFASSWQDKIFWHIDNIGWKIWNRNEIKNCTIKITIQKDEGNSNKAQIINTNNIKSAMLHWTCIIIIILQGNLDHWKKDERGIKDL